MVKPHTIIQIDRCHDHIRDDLLIIHNAFRHIGHSRLLAFDLMTLIVGLSIFC